MFANNQLEESPGHFMGVLGRQGFGDGPFRSRTLEREDIFVPIVGFVEGANKVDCHSFEWFANVEWLKGCSFESVIPFMGITSLTCFDVVVNKDVHFGPIIFQLDFLVPPMEPKMS